MSSTPARPALRVRIEHPDHTAPRAAMSAELAAAAVLEARLLVDDTQVVIYGGTADREPLVLIAPDSQRGTTPTRTRLETLSPDDPRRVYLRHLRRRAADRLTELRDRERFESFTGPDGAEPELVEYLRQVAAHAAARAQVTDARVAAHLDGSVPAMLRAVTEWLAAALEADEVPEPPHHRRHTDDISTGGHHVTATTGPNAPPLSSRAFCRHNGITRRRRAPA